MILSPKWIAPNEHAVPVIPWLTSSMCVWVPSCKVNVLKMTGKCVDISSKWTQLNMNVKTFDIGREAYS